MARGVFGNEALPWEPLLHMQEYLDNLAIDERSSDYIRVVKQALSLFAANMRAQGIEHPDEIERNHILRFQAALATTGMAKTTRIQRMKYVRAWINWMTEVGHITASPWVRIRAGNYKKLPNPLENEEVELVFDAHKRSAFSMAPFAFHRREVILVLLYAWGLRIHELHSLNVAQMDVRQDWVTAINKGGTTKPLPYGPEIKQVVARWLRVRVQHASYDDDALLIDGEGKRLSIQMIRKIVTELGQKSGVPIHPHRLRDTAGTVMLDHDVPVERVMKVLGHTSRAQTLQYARVNDHKVAESHEATFGPLLEGLVLRRTGTPR